MVVKYAQLKPKKGHGQDLALCGSSIIRQECGQEDRSGVEESILKLWHTLTLLLHATPNPLTWVGSITLSRVG
jgi:hypothetical protein